MRNIEQVTQEIKNGATLIINSHKEGKVDHCNGYVCNKEGKKEEIEILKVFIKYIHILDEVREGQFFKLTKDDKTGKYLSGIYNKETLIEEKSYEKDYMFDSLNVLNDKLKKIKKLGGYYGRN